MCIENKGFHSEKDQIMTSVGREERAVEADESDTIEASSSVSLWLCH